MSTLYLAIQHTPFSDVLVGEFVFAGNGLFDSEFPTRQEQFVRRNFCGADFLTHPSLLFNAVIRPKTGDTTESQEGLLKLRENIGVDLRIQFVENNLPMDVHSVIVVGAHLEERRVREFARISNLASAAGPDIDQSTPFCFRIVGLTVPAREVPHAEPSRCYFPSPIDAVYERYQKMLELDGERHDLDSFEFDNLDDFEGYVPLPDISTDDSIDIGPLPRSLEILYPEDSSNLQVDRE